MLWNRQSDTTLANGRLIAASPDMLEAMVNTYSEFKRLREKATHIKDMLYLDGVLSVLDTYMVPAVEKVTGKEISEVLEAIARRVG